MIPAVLVGLVAYLVGSLFLSIFSFSCTAILHCFILDEDTGGSDLTPDALQPFLDMNDARNQKEAGFSKVEGEKPATGKDEADPNKID